MTRLLQADQTLKRIDAYRTTLQNNKCRSSRPTIMEDQLALASFAFLWWASNLVTNQFAVGRGGLCWSAVVIKGRDGKPANRCFPERLTSHTDFIPWTPSHWSVPVQDARRPISLLGRFVFRLFSFFRSPNPHVSGPLLTSPWIEYQSNHHVHVHVQHDSQKGVEGG